MYDLPSRKKQVGTRNFPENIYKSYLKTPPITISTLGETAFGINNSVRTIYSQSRMFPYIKQDSDGIFEYVLTDFKQLPS